MRVWASMWTDSHAIGWMIQFLHWRVYIHHSFEMLCHLSVMYVAETRECCLLSVDHGCYSLNDNNPPSCVHIGSN